jgi:LysM repeat protein
MVIDRLLNRFTLIMALLLVVAGLSACYKDAGDDMEPTSNRVDLSDIAPTTPATPTPMITAIPTTQPLATTTRTLVPTTTPADFVPDEQPTAEPTESTLVDEPDAVPTNTPQFAPSFTPAVTFTPTEPGITTPGMSDIQPSPTTTPTLDPAFLPTPTALPVEENPCIHIVKPNDTLYSIAQDNSILLTDLVTANAGLLGGNPNTPLQIGWQLQIPGCIVPGTEPTATSEAEVDTGAEVTPTAVPQEGFPKNHTVQAGETIYSIGRLYGVDPQAIINANNMVNPNLIQPGDTLVIPAPE